MTLEPKTTQWVNVITRVSDELIRQSIVALDTGLSRSLCSSAFFALVDVYAIFY